MRTRLLLVFALIASAVMIPATSAGAAPLPMQCGPHITLTPPFGGPGTQVSVNVFNFNPNDTVTVILRVPGNPVVATGTTDAEGHANIVFTMQDFSGSQVAILATASPCFAAGAYFRFAAVTPHDHPTPTPTTPPPATTVPPTVATTVPPTPRPPIAGGDGDASGFGSAGMNLALAGLTLAIFCGAFAIWGATRQTRPVRVRITRHGDDES
jgi:hypothetical protein